MKYLLSCIKLKISSWNDTFTKFEFHLNCFSFCQILTFNNVLPHHYTLLTIPSLFSTHVRFREGGTSLTTSSVPSTNRQTGAFFSRIDKKKKSNRELQHATDESPYEKRHFLYGHCYLTLPLLVCVIKIDPSFFSRLAITA